MAAVVVVDDLCGVRPADKWSHGVVRAGLAKYISQDDAVGVA
jgi:hypothetical protein